MFPFKYIHAHDCLELLEFQDYVGGHSFGNILARPCSCLRLGELGVKSAGYSSGHSKSVFENVLSKPLNLNLG